MQNLQPPTDNLYKFLALTGIVLIVRSVVFYSTAYYQVQIKEFDLTNKRAVARAEYESWIAAEIRAEQRQQGRTERFEHFREFVAKRPVDTVPEHVRQGLKDEAASIDKEKAELREDRARNIELTRLPQRLT